MTSDSRDLQAWYREAMLRRIDELVALRPALRTGSPDAADELRRVAQALRGSGGTFGFPAISSVAGVVELTADDQALRRMEGLLSELRRFVGSLRGERTRVFEWLAAAAEMELDTVEEVLGDAEDVAEAWERVREGLRLDDAELARRVGAYFGLEVADPGRGGRAAQRLLPEAFMASEGCVPLREDSESITLATGDPVSLPLEVQARRLTGRRPVFAVAPPGLVAAALTAVLEGAASRGDAPAPPARAQAPTGAQASTDAEVDEADGSSTDPASVSGVPSEDASSDRASSSAAPPSGESTPAGTSPSLTSSHRREGVHGGETDVSGGTGGSRVLVVDDEASARVLVRTLLEKRGYEAVEAADGVEALRIIEEEGSVGMAVVDLKMPRMDGLELIWEIRDTQRWAGLPVIVVTGERDEVLETWVMEEGADDYVRKPIDPRLFLARVESTLRRREARATAGGPRTG